MADLMVGKVDYSPLDEGIREKQTKQQPLEDFRKILGDSIREVNGLLQQADEDTRDVILGKKDIHQAMISIERAHISLRLMIQVRNKIISAYEEIMRMQI
jgi:flagellar hook-basal body complex protein FliE